MILTCPACQTQYVIPEEALGTKARTVRCASCHYSWRQEPITVTEIDLTQPAAFETMLGDAPASTTEDEDMSAAEMARQLRWQQAMHIDVEQAAPALDHKKLLKQAGIWFLCLLAATGITLGYLRQTMVRAWPASALLYETLGIPQPAAGEGLKFGDESLADLDPKAVPTRLHVKGEFTNTKPHSVRMPILQARLFTADGRWLKDWSIPLGRYNYIGGHKTLAFDYTLPQVPNDGQRLTFRFTDE